MANSSTSRLTQTRAEYNALSGVWTYNIDAYDNQGGFIDGGHLIAYVRETPEGFERRKSRCWFPNFAKDVAVTLSGHLFKKPATRDFGTNANLLAFKDSTNQKGDITLQEFMKQVETHSYVFGYCMVLVDKPATEQSNRAEELENGKPYAYIIDPPDMLDWELDEAGEFKWVKLRETYRTEADDPFGTHDTKSRYRIWTKEGWTLYDSDETQIGSGEHNLNRVPLIMVKHDESLKYPTIGTSTFTSIVQLAVRLFNALSERDNILLGATFPILTLPTTDQLSQKAGDDDTTSEKNNPALGVGSVVAFDPESRHAPAFINHDGKTVENYDKLIESLIKQMQQLARLEFTGGTYTSGVAMAFDFEKTNQALIKKAETLRDSELAVLRLVDLWMDGTGELDGIIVDYPGDYNIMDVEKTLKNIFATLELNISETFDKEVRKQSSRKILPAIPDKTQKIIDAEIDAAVKPIDELDDDEGEGDL